jgi:hypothetical protein
VEDLSLSPLARGERLGRLAAQAVNRYNFPPVSQTERSSGCAGILPTPALPMLRSRLATTVDRAQTTVMSTVRVVCGTLGDGIR